MASAKHSSPKDDEGVEIQEQERLNQNVENEKVNKNIV